MKAALCVAYGPPETLQIVNLPTPTPGPGEALVRVTRVALNFFDTLIIENKYQIKPTLPFSPGGEFAGEIISLGTEAEKFRIGDRVAGCCSYGAARTHLIVKITDLVPVPDVLSDDQAAGLFVTYGTTLHALRQRARLQPGERLAVLGASGGVGLSAVEIGRAMGAHVIACASSGDKLAFARRHGAHEDINYAEEDLKTALKSRTHGQGVDVVYDPIGGDYSEAALRALAWKGRFLVIGFAAGTIPKIPLNLALLKGCDILGVFWGEFIKREPQVHVENMRMIFDWTAKGILSAHLHAVYPLEQIAEALYVLKRREALGKVVLSVT